MKFPIDFFQQKRNPDEIYLGLFLKEKEGIVLFIQTRNNKLEVMAKEPFTYTNGWDNIIEDVDDTLYKLETYTKKSPEKAIFFIYSHLVDDISREIKRPILHKIKELSKNLELKPLGYIECHEGITEHYKKKDGVVPTVTFIELDSSFLTVFIYKESKVIFKETVQKSQEIIDDLIPIFEKVKHITTIPTRVVLYDSKSLGLEAEKILSYRWSAELFAQLPKVDLVSEEELIESLVDTFSVQVLSPSVEQVQENAPKGTFGFVIGGDVVPREEIQKEPVEEFGQEAYGQRPNVLNQFTTWLSLFSNSVTSRIKAYIANLKTVPIPALVIVGIFLIGLALFLMEYSFHKAEVTIFFPAEKIEQTLLVPASTSQIQALKLTPGTTTTQFNESRGTTGKKDIGEKAKGTVTIYNSSLTEGKNFSKGTTITSSNGVAFLLNSDVKVASASGDATSVTPSTAKVDVTAEQIGPEGNLASSTKFSIEDQSAVIIAKNDFTFTGGVKRTVRTVAKQDIDDLRKRALDKAKKFNDKEIEKTLKRDTKILKNLSDVELTDPQFSRDTGEEAQEVSLKTGIKATYYKFQEEDLFKFIINQMKTKIKSGYELNKASVQYSVKKIEKKKNDYDVTFTIKAKEVKSIAQKEIEDALPGKTDTQLETIFKEKYGVSGLEFQIQNPLPLFKDRMPFFKKNITVKVSYL